MKKATRNWIATSKYDIETAKHMLKSGRYVYVVFMCHLSVEKLLKGLVAETQEDLPPKTQIFAIWSNYQKSKFRKSTQQFSTY